MNSKAFAPIVRPCRLLLCAGILTTLTSTVLLADPRCQQLEALNRQYAGVKLTAEQQSLKRQLVAWYNSNCRAASTRAASR